MRYEDVIQNGKFQGKKVDEELFVQLYDKGLITDDDYFKHVNEFKPEFKVKQALKYLFIAALVLWLGVIAAAYIFANWLIGLLK